MDLFCLLACKELNHGNFLGFFQDGDNCYQASFKNEQDIYSQLVLGVCVCMFMSTRSIM